jgi:hypothetical protein
VEVVSAAVPVVPVEVELVEETLVEMEPQTPVVVVVELAAKVPPVPLVDQVLFIFAMRLT